MDIPSPKEIGNAVSFIKLPVRDVSKDIAKYLLRTCEIKDKIDNRYNQVIFFTERECGDDDKVFSHVSRSSKFMGKRVTITAVVVLTFDKGYANEGWGSHCDPHSFDLYKLKMHVGKYMDKRNRPGCMMDVGRNEKKRCYIRWYKEPKIYLSDRNIRTPFYSPQI